MGADWQSSSTTHAPHHHHRALPLQRAGGGQKLYITINKARSQAVLRAQAKSRAAAATPPPPPPGSRSTQGISLMKASQIGRRLLDVVGGWLPIGQRRPQADGAPTRGRSLQQQGTATAAVRLDYAGYEVELAAGQPPRGLTVQLDADGRPVRVRKLGPRGNRVMAGVYLHQTRAKVADVVVANGSASCSSAYAGLMPGCVRDKASR